MPSLWFNQNFRGACNCIHVLKTHTGALKSLKVNVTIFSFEEGHDSNFMKLNLFTKAWLISGPVHLL